MALTIAETKTGALGSPPPSLTATTACSVGDVIVAAALSFSSAANTFAFSDSVNTGTYTNIGTQLRDVSAGVSMQFAWIKCNAAGTPTLSCTLGTNENTKLVYARITGWTGTPTVDSSMSSNFVEASSATVAITPPNTAFNSELVLLLWKAAQNLNSTPTGWTSQQSQELFSIIAPTSGTSTAFNGTLAAASIQDAQVIGIYDLVTATPTVTSVNSGSSISEGATNVPVVGTNFASGMTAAITQPGGVSVSQTFTYSTSTSGTFNLTVEPGTGDQLAFTDATYTTDFEVTVSGQTSTPFAITIQPPAGLIFQTLTSVNSTSAYRITATPDLAIGDQLEAAGDSSGTTAAPTGLVLNSDATFYFQAGDTAVPFWVRVYDGTNKVWGSWALQTINAASSTAGLMLLGVGG